MQYKTESIQEFLARGGKITKVPEKEETLKPQVIKRTTVSGGISSIITYEDVEAYYGRKKAVKQNTQLKDELAQIRENFMALPKALRDKEIAKLKAKMEQDDGNEA